LDSNQDRIRAKLHGEARIDRRTRVGTSVADVERWTAPSGEHQATKPSTAENSSLNP
jgi:hypothetical protein